MWHRRTSISAILTSTKYGRSTLVQQNMATPCKVAVEMSLTLKIRLMELVETKYSESTSCIILALFFNDRIKVESLSNETHDAKSLKIKKKHTKNNRYQRYLASSKRFPFKGNKSWRQRV